MLNLDRIGYCCICNTLRNRKPIAESVYCSRSLIKRTFTIRSASERALANCRDLLTILKWNESNGIRCFRISSELLPRFTCQDKGYEFSDLPHASQIRSALAQCGEYSYTHNHKLSFHPGPFTTIASPTETAQANGIQELLYHNLLCDLIDPDNHLQIDINIHVGGSYGGDFQNTADRFIAAYNSLPDSLKRRLCVENDDKASCWSVQYLYNYIHKKCGVPICFDTHHWHFCHSDASIESDFQLALSTWNRPVQVHHSESRDSSKLVTAHSDYYTSPLPSFLTNTDSDVYVHLESKQKELALLDYRKRFCS